VGKLLKMNKFLSRLALSGDCSDFDALEFCNDYSFWGRDE